MNFKTVVFAALLGLSSTGLFAQTVSPSNETTSPLQDSPRTMLLQQAVEQYINDNYASQLYNLIGSVEEQESYFFTITDGSTEIKTVEIKEN